LFIDKGFAEENRLPLEWLENPILAKNVDGTLNKNGTIEYSTTLNLEINGKIMRTWLLVSGLGKETVILGLPWLRKTNPDIDWKKGTLKFWMKGTETTIRSLTTSEKSYANQSDCG
jgi:hypothetical protein